MSEQNEVKLPPLKDRTSAKDAASPEKDGVLRVAPGTEGGQTKDSRASDEGAQERGPVSEHVMPRVWNELSARSRRPRHESPSQKPSETVPGMDTPIDVLLNRYLSGQTITINANPTYNEQIPPEYDSYDKVEKAHFAQNVNKSLDKYENELREREAKAKADEIQAFKDEIAQLRAERADGLARTEGEA